MALKNLHATKQTFSAVLFLLLLVPLAGYSSDYKKGLKAYKNRNYDEALNYMKAAADDGEVDALYYLANSYRFASIANKDVRQYLTYMGRFIAGRGNQYDVLYSGALYDLWTEYTKKESPFANKDSAVKYAMIAYRMTPPKDDNVPSFICSMAADYLHPRNTFASDPGGPGGPKTPDDGLAFLFAKRSALLGFVDGMETLAAFYKYGIGTEQSNAAAIAWCKEAIAHGSDRCRYMLAELTGTKPVFREGDYRRVEAEKKELEAHPERQLTKADLPGSGYVTSEESKAYDVWWERTYGSGRVQGEGKRPAATTQWGTPDKTARERDQEMYDKMRRDQEAREKAYNDKWGR